MWEDYVLAASAEEAVAVLEKWAGRARVIAGGTDLLIDLAERRKAADCLVDISGIPELKTISLDSGGNLVVGAAVTHAEAGQSPLVRCHAAALAEAALSVGSPQIRNQGTIGGNLLNAQPAADTAVVLAALDAVAEVLGPGGVRSVPVLSLYSGEVGRSTVDSSREVVTRIVIPAGNAGTGSAFERLAKRRALALPILNCAAVVAVKGGRVAWGRLALGPVARTPFRAVQAEKLLAGLSPADEQGLARVADAVAADVNPRESVLRGSAAYRREVSAVLTERAVREAIRRSMTGGGIR
ncbi:MAG: FAD binding domain-containing protein [Firmicutes bacterium]|nr:FAD binding domain-containing protein [Bacillota bacterium]